MIEIGKMQTLQVAKEVSFGVYLREPAANDKNTEKTNAEKAQPGGEEILLPAAQVPENVKPGDTLEVFVYRDSKDRLIATTKEPYLMCGQAGRLRVKQVTKIGAFLDWGLEKDLLMPFREQGRVRVKEGEEVLVMVYEDKSGRLCATRNVYPALSSDSPYRTGDEVEGTVYETGGNFGTFVAVDDVFQGLIPKQELVRDIPVGERIRARVTRVRPDGKLNLAVREKAYLQIEDDADRILEALQKKGGRLPFTDKADPALIRKEMQMSKNEFKRAVGRLLKQGKITIGEEEIRIAE